MTKSALQARTKSGNAWNFIIAFLLLLLIALHLIEMSFGRTNLLLVEPPNIASTFLSSSTTLTTKKEESSSSTAKANIPSSAFLTAENFTLAYQDSLGFFTGITNEVWQHRRSIARNRRPGIYPVYNNRVSPRSLESPKTWYQQNWEPDLACINEEMIGNMGDGHKWVCNPHRIEEQSQERLAKQQPPCLVYSIGSNGMFDFERDVQKYMPSCEIHTFDFTDYHRRIPGNLKINYHVWGLKPSYDTPTLQGRKGFQAGFGHKIWEHPKLNQVFKTIQDTMKELGHEGRTIDIFKIDIEGGEWYSYKDWVQNPAVDIRQIQVEVHDTPDIVHDFFQAIHDANFAMFHKEPNIQWASGDCVEFAFLKMSPSFFGKSETTVRTTARSGSELLRKPLGQSRTRRLRHLHNE